MMKIYDGREFFYQWDLSQKITSDAFEVGDKIHFFNIRQTNALVVSAYELDGKVVADVPNILLQTAIPIKVWKYVHGENSAQTVMEDTFKVEQRAQPYDYFYTETELYELRKDIENTAAEAKDAVSQLQTGLDNAEHALELATEAEKTSTENEQARITAEQQRALAEENRVSAETERVKAENDREKAEATRNKNESDRVDAETDREVAEASRVDMENGRRSFETARDKSEYERVKAENIRQENESSRVSAEEHRQIQERNRQTSETTRLNAETARNEAESQRVTAEQSRVEAEAQRVTAEQKRVVAEELRQANFESSQNNISNAVKGYASGEVVRVDDVSPIEHIASVKVSGKNLWNTLVIESTSAITVNADGTITVGGGKYYCPTGKTVSQVCPSLKIGDIVAFSINTNGSPYIYLSGSNVGGVSNKKTLTVTDDILSSEVVLYGAEQSTEDYNEPHTISSIQIEKGYTATEYEPYIDPTSVTVTVQDESGENVATYTPAADGTCEVVSVSPTMTLFTDTAGANIEVEYNQDTNAAQRNLQEQVDNKVADNGDFLNYNKLDIDKANRGHWLNADGVVVANSSFNVTDYIPCRTGKYIIVTSAKQPTSAAIRGIEYCDVNKKQIAYSAENGKNGFTTISDTKQGELNYCWLKENDVPNCYYIRLVIPNSIFLNAVVEVRDYDLSIKKWVIENDVGSFQDKVACLEVDYAAGKKLDVPYEKELPYWRGKTIVWNGDSIAAGWESRAGYHDIVGKNLGCETINCSYPSGTLAVKEGATTERNPLIDRYADMPNNADLVCIAIGTNDWCYSHTPFGDMTSTDKYTFYGALKLLCEGLLKKYIGKPIVFFTPIKRIQSDAYSYWEQNANGKTLEDYANAIKEVCGYYGIPVLDLFNECLINPVIEEIKTAYIPDGVHPNIHGHKILARRITGYIKQLADGVF